jgi:hypothetical protein
MLRIRPRIPHHHADEVRDLSAHLFRPQRSGKNRKLILQPIMRHGIVHNRQMPFLQRPHPRRHGRPIDPHIKHQLAEPRIQRPLRRNLRTRRRMHHTDLVGRPARIRKRFALFIDRRRNHPRNIRARRQQLQFVIPLRTNAHSAHHKNCSSQNHCSHSKLPTFRRREYVLPSGICT